MMCQVCFFLLFFGKSYLIGNSVKIGDGPAAVTGDTAAKKPLTFDNRLGRSGNKWMIRKSEDLPGKIQNNAPRGPDVLFYMCGLKT